MWSSLRSHNEERTIGRLLDGLLSDAEPDEFDIVVVCNGCSNDTAAVARRRGPRVRVIELDRPSKHWAHVEGDHATHTFPRLYVDADVELDTSSARMLAEALCLPGTLAAGPARKMVLDRRSPIVRSYYRVWARLPAVRDGLFGRGVVGLTSDGHSRLGERPELFGDDLYGHTRFADVERRIVPGARSRIRAPSTVGDLVRRRTRAAEGNAQLIELDRSTATASISARAVVRFARAEPALWLHLPAFLAITLAGRIQRLRRRSAGRGSETWLGRGNK